MITSTRASWSLTLQSTKATALTPRSHLYHLRTLCTRCAHSNVPCASGGSLTIGDKTVPQSVLPLTFRALYSSQPQSEEGVARRWWRKFATLIRAFMTGTKSLYSDVKKMYELTKRHRLIITGAAPQETELGKTDVGFTRAELQFMFQTQKDLRKMLPTVVLFFIPVLGYIVPFVVFMYPQHMLSQHFLTEEQRMEFSRAASEVKDQQLHLLVQHLKDQFPAEKWSQLKGLLHEVWHDGDMAETVHHLDNTLKTLRGNHLEYVCGMWGVSAGPLSSVLPWRRRSTMRRRLATHLRYIYTCDWLVEVEGGVKDIAEGELEQLCKERCSLEEGSNDMKDFLQTWTTTSKQFTECPLYLLAHLPLAQLKSL